MSRIDDLLDRMTLAEKLGQLTMTASSYAVTGPIIAGDSGGPVLLDGAVVALTSYSNSNSGSCRSVSGYQRVDVASARDWLATVTG